MTKKRHPEDAIYEIRVFLKQLSKIQEDYFEKLVKELNLPKKSEDWLFDYIFNTTEEDGYEDFEDYLSRFGVSLKEILSDT